MPRSIYSHVRSNLVGYVALFFALGLGTAWASHLTVFSDDIVNGEVKTADIGGGEVQAPDIGAEAVNTGKLRDRAVTADKLGNSKGDEAAGAFVTGSDTIVDGPGGPSVTVNIPTNGIVIPYARATLDTTGTDVGLCKVWVDIPGLDPLTAIGRSGGFPAATFHSNPAFREPTPGNQTITMKYQVEGGDADDTCSFSDRGLWVQVIRP